MQLYTGIDLARGAGIFDYIMATEVEREERLTGMRSRDAIGIIAAAFASDLTTEQVEELIEQFFLREDQNLLHAILKMYDGGDKRLQLWNRKEEGTERLCPHLRYNSRPEWRLTAAHKGKLAI